jgi:putative ABC transport system substrate-binding protein
VPGPQAQFTSRTEAFRQGLRQFGYVDGENAVVEYRYAEHGVDSLPILAQELVQLQPEVIVTSGPSARAASQATTTIPIVFAGVTDPVGTGLISSLARPGGNLTGLSSIAPDLEGKRLELLREVVPRLSSVAFFLNPANAFHTVSVRQALAAAQALQIRLLPQEVRKAEDLDAAFATIVKEKPDALLILADRVFLHDRQRMMDFATQQKLPSVNAYRELVEAGGLMSYGPSYEDMHRRAAIYVDKILKGAKPGELAIEQPAKFNLLLNLKAAKALGLAVPPTLLARADEVIE